MGQQIAESSIVEAIRRRAEPGEIVVARHLAGLRSSTPHARRYPIGRLATASYRSARRYGALAYRTRGMVHRFDLRLPPYPGVEILTIHDLPPFRFDDEGELPASAAQGARDASAVIAPSEFAAAEVTELLALDPSRVSVVPNGVGVEFGTAIPPDRDLLAAIGIASQRYVLHTGGATKRKNLGALAAAWRAVADREPDVGLCLVGPRDPRRDEAFRGLSRVHIVDHQPPAVIARLMAGAAAVVVPSRYEGFGLPALEAMASGVPVVASNAGALPEVCGDAALLVDPEPAPLGEAIIAVLSPDSPIAARLRQAGPARAARFSWDTAAVAYLDIYRRNNKK